MEDSIFTSVCDASNVPLAVSVGTSHYPAIAGKSFDLAADGTIRKTVFGFVSYGTFQQHEVEGLPGFGELLDSFAENQFTVLGTSPELSGGDVVPFGSKNHPATSGLIRDKTNFTMPTRPCVVFFDLDRSSTAPAPAVEKTRGALIKVMPELADVGFLVRGSASAGVYRDGEVEPDVRTGGERLYFCLKDGTTLTHFKHVFFERAAVAGLVQVKIDKAGKRRFAVMLDENTELDLSVFSAERIDFNGPNRVGPGLLRKRWSAEFVPGGLLDAGVLTLSPAEAASAEALRVDMYEKAAPEAAVIAKRWREEHGKALPKAVGKTAVKTLERHYSKLEAESKGVSKSGLPIVHILPGMSLDFAKFDKIDVADVLREPGKFDDLCCLDPIEPEKGLRGRFYAENMHVFSFSSGGYLSKLTKIEVIFNHDRPLQTMQEIDAAMALGCPDLFMRGGEVVQVGKDGVIKSITKELLPILAGRLVKFLEWKQNRAGEWNLVPMSPSVSFWQAFASRPDSGLPVLNGVRSCPFFHNGQLVTQRGYHGETGLFLTHDFKLNERRIVKATRADAESAVTFINENL